MIGHGRGGRTYKVKVETLLGHLKKNKDDFLFAHSHSGFDFDGSGCRPGEKFSDFELENDRVYCTLRVMYRGAIS